MTDTDTATSEENTENEHYIRSITVGSVSGGRSYSHSIPENE
jgi:hypothetical protein